MITSPTVVNRLGNVVFMRACAAGGIGAVEVAAFHRRTAFDATLFTFCPPGPPERAKLHSSSSSGMAMVSVMVSMAFSSSEMRTLQAVFSFHRPAAKRPGLTARRGLPIVRGRAEFARALVRVHMEQSGMGPSPLVGGRLEE